MGFFDWGKKSAQQNTSTPKKTDNQMPTAIREPFNAGVDAAKRDRLQQQERDRVNGLGKKK